MQLSLDGFFGCHDYIKHATRGTLSIQSLYLILWSNFCGFSIALLTQKDAEQKLAGKIISEEEPLRHYCVTQMFKVWNLLKDGLNISEEERLLLVRGCLSNILEVCFSTMYIVIVYYYYYYYGAQFIKYYNAA